MSEQQSNGNDGIRVAIGAGIQIGATPVQWVHQTPYAIVPPGCKVEDLNGLLSPLQQRRKALAISRKFVEVKSFVKYVERYREAQDREGRLLLTASAGQESVTADFVAPLLEEALDNPWKHTAEVKQGRPVAILEWLRIDGKQIPQADFADFLVERYRDLYGAVSGADLLQVARRLTATTKVEYESGVNRTNGDIELLYKQRTDARAESLTIPSEFTLRIPLYSGQEPEEIRVLLRWRLDENKRLFFVVKLCEMGQLKECAFEEMVEQIEKALGVDVYRVA